MKKKKLEATGPNDYADRIFIATYGAAFAGMVQERMHSGRGAPEDDDYDRYHEDAETIAREAEDRWLKQLGVTDE